LLTLYEAGLPLDFRPVVTLFTGTGFTRYGVGAGLTQWAPATLPTLATNATASAATTTASAVSSGGSPAAALGGATAGAAWALTPTLALLKDPSFWTVTLLYPAVYSVLVEVRVGGKWNDTVWFTTGHNAVSLYRTTALSPGASVTTLTSSFSPYVVLVCSCQVAVKLFTALAARLNNFENHQTQTVYMNRLILKVRHGNGNGGVCPFFPSRRKSTLTDPLYFLVACHYFIRTVLLLLLTMHHFCCSQGLRVPLHHGLHVPLLLRVFHEPRHHAR